MQRVLPDGSSMEVPLASSSMTVVLTISARDLRDIDINSVSDPYCVVSRVVNSGQRSKKMEEVGRTEVINNCLDPDFATKIKVTFYRGYDQRFKFHHGAANKRRILGSASTSIDEIMDATWCRIALNLLSAHSFLFPIIDFSYDGKQRGTLTVAADEVKPGRQESVYFVVSGSNLDKKDFLGKCDPFLKISRINYDNTLQVAFRTKYREQTLNPKWKPFEIPIDQLCYGDKNREFIIECFDWDQDGNHDIVGACATTVNRLINHQDISLKLIHVKKARKSKKYVDSGELQFQRVYVWMDHDYMDFINSGTNLEFMMGISFPSSWQDSRVHEDQYDTAIRSITDIFAKFQLQNRQFDAYGMGARIVKDRSSHTIFPLNVATSSPRCDGVQNLLYAYHQAIKKVELTGHSQFAPLIRVAAQAAQRFSHDSRHYLVLILITDGTIVDLERTKQEIVKASMLPLSIIIIGLGYDSFEEMKILDGDDAILSYNGKSARRDIVQFVELRRFLPPHRRLSDLEMQDAKKELEKEMKNILRQPRRFVLQELPLQMTSYMKSQGLSPGTFSRQSVPNSFRGSSSRHHTPTRGQYSESVPSTPRIRRQLPKIPTAELQKLRIQ